MQGGMGEWMVRIGEEMWCGRSIVGVYWGRDVVWEVHCRCRCSEVMVNAKTYG